MQNPGVATNRRRGIPNQKRIDGTPVPRQAWALALRLNPPPDLGKLFGGQGAPVLSAHGRLARRSALSILRRKLPRLVEAALRSGGGQPADAGSRGAKAGAPSSGKVELPRFDAKVTYQHPSALGGARAVVTFNSPLDVPAGTFAKTLLDELKRAGLALGVRQVDLLNDEEGRQEVVLKLGRLRLVPDSLEHGRLKAGLACYREQGAVVLAESGEEYRLRGLKALLSPVLAGEVETALGQPDGDFWQADDEFSASLIASAESWAPGGKRGLAARRALAGC